MPSSRLLLVVVAVALVLPGTASAASLTKHRGALTGPLAELERGRAVSLPAAGPGSFVRRGPDVVVDVRATTTSAAQVARVRAAGARVLHVAPELRTITAAVAPAELDAVAAVAGVENVSPELMPVTSAGEAAPTCQGAVVSEADTQLNAALARQDFEVSGAGVKVGVISDSYDVATTDGGNANDGVASGDLPGIGNPCDQTTPVDVLAEGPATGTDEGRGMLELVHDLAPGADLAFATATPETAFGDRVAALAASGSDVVVDDVGYYDEPFFQPGPADVAIERARDAGTAYFSAAGNFNQLASGQNRSSWEAPGWRSTTCPSGFPADYTGCMNFAGAGATASNQLTIRVAPGQHLIIDFQWAQPWFGVDTDLDVALFSGSTVVAASESQNNGATGTQKPFELLGWTNGSANTVDVSLVIAKYGNGPDPGRMKGVLTGGGAAVIGPIATQDRLGPAIFGHNGAEAGMSVAAVPYSDASQVEPFSSRGPVTHYFGPVDGTTPAAALAAPKTLAKPDVAATDGALTTFFPTGSRFFGTSAAAPHAAAVAALALAAAPEATVEDVYDTLRATARPVGTFGVDAAGSGLIDAYAALDRITKGPPIPVGLSVTGVTSSGATLSGTVNPHRLSTTARFQYGTSGGSTLSTPGQAIGEGKADVDVSAPISGLLPNATYTYRVVASNSAGTAQGEDRTFTTASVAPTAVTGAATAITASGATLAGTANPQGTATSAHFEYGPTDAYGAATASHPLGAGRAATNVTSSLTGLEPATVYHYRLVTSNSAGTTRGDDQTFATASAPPAAVTGAASAVTRSDATLAGTADPHGTGTSARFEYGPTTAYGSETEATDVGSGRAPVDVTESLAGLTPGTTYHYRLVATNAAGTTNGADRTLTTTKPAVVTPPPHTAPTAPPAPPHTIPPPTFRPARTIALTLSGRTLRVTGAGDVTRAVVRVRKGRRTLARKRPAVRAGAMKLRLRWSDVRNGRAVTVSLGGSEIRIDLAARKVRLKVGGTFTRATVQVRRSSATLAPPAQMLTLRLDHKRRPRNDRVVVVVVAP
jgi:hypothetical protein